MRILLLLIMLLAVPAEACSGWVLWRYTMAPRGYTYASVRLAFETKKECDAAAPAEAASWATFIRTRPKIAKVEYRPAFPTSVSVFREGQSESEDVEFRCMPDGIDLREAPPRG